MIARQEQCGEIRRTALIAGSDCLNCDRAIGPTQQRGVYA
jgi:hypothetical protein